MADLFTTGLPNVDVNSAFLYILIGAVVLAFGGMMIINRRYPRRPFVIRENGEYSFRMFRLDSIKIIEDNIFNLIRMKNEPGENIEDFSKVRMMGKVAYAAELKNGVLFPLDMTTVKNEIEYKDIMMGKAIARRYIETQKFIDANTKANEPILVALATILPVALVALIILGGTFWVVNEWLNKAGPMIDSVTKSCAANNYEAQAGNQTKPYTASAYLPNTLNGSTMLAGVGSSGV